MGETALQLAGQPEVRESPLTSSVLGGLHYVSTQVTTVVMEPVQVQGEKVVFEPSIMRPDFPYFFELLGVSVVAFKRHDESIDFYQLPRE